MAITSQALKLDESGWAVNATSSNAIGGEQIKAAPGTSKTLLLKELHISAGQSAMAIIDSRASATATATRLLGPITLNASTNNYQNQFVRGIRTNAVNEALYVTSSGNAYVNVYASGEVL
jgi:hypothetical protein